MVFAAKSDDAPRSAEALEKLCRTYWPPLYAYIRREGHGAEDAQDLTQEFFARLLKKDYLAHLRDQRGKFRSFLLTFLKHFLSDERAKAAAHKRGGGRKFISLDDTSAAEADYQTEAVTMASPDQLFERRWAQTVLERALHRLRGEYTASGKTALFERLKDVQHGQHGDISYAELGKQFELSEGGIKSAVHRLRRRHRELLREEIAHTVSKPEEIDEEIRHLLAVLSR
jgi:RNA polymerase sigma-70 factor (ECF subfamily)